MTLRSSILALLVLCWSAHAAADGAALVARHCTQCHGTPLPGQLPKQAWPELFQMMNGIVRTWPDEGTHPAKTLTRHQPWDQASNEAMLEYFIEHAPDEAQIRESVRARKKPALPLTEADFQPTPLGLPHGHFLTMLKYDARSQLMLLGLGQTLMHQGERKLLKANALAMMSLSGATASLSKHPSPPIHADLLENSFRLTLIGDMAEDTGDGEVIEFSSQQGKPTQTRLLRDLPRPVGSRSADFDGDGSLDLFVSGFGGNRGTGESAIHWGSATDEAEKQVIFAGSGSLDGEVADFDGDGKPDILLLIAQRTQALRLYLNRGQRQFEEHTLIQRHVGWGYMDLALADMDADGDLDVVTVAGNNMEFDRPPLKAYHGIRVWLNDSEQTTAKGRAKPSLREAYSYPLYGAGQVLIVDADGDGALDIAATAFTPDWQEEWPETFVLLRQTARKPALAFQPYHPTPAHWRRWTYLSAGPEQAGGGSTVLLGDTWLPFGAPNLAPPRLQEMLDRPSRIYSLQHSPSADPYRAGANE